MSADNPAAERLRDLNKAIRGENDVYADLGDRQSMQAIILEEDTITARLAKEQGHDGIIHRKMTGTEVIDLEPVEANGGALPTKEELKIIK